MAWSEDLKRKVLRTRREEQKKDPRVTLILDVTEDEVDWLRRVRPPASPPPETPQP